MATHFASRARSIALVALLLCVGIGASAPLHVAADPPKAFTVSGSVTGGGSITIKVTLASTATKNEAVTLRSNRPSIITVPATMTVPKGSKTVSISVVTKAVKTNVEVLISGKWQTWFSSSSTVLVKAPVVSAVRFGQASVTGSETVDLLVRLNAKAPSGGLNLGLKASRASLITNMPSNVVIRTGSTGAYVPISFRAISTTASITFTVTFNGVKTTTSITLNALLTPTPIITSTLPNPSASPTSIGTATLPAATWTAPASTSTPTNQPTMTPPASTSTPTPFPPTPTPLAQVTGITLNCPASINVNAIGTCYVNLVGIQIDQLPNQTVTIWTQNNLLGIAGTVILPPPGFGSGVAFLVFSAPGTETVYAQIGIFLASDTIVINAP